MFYQVNDGNAKCITINLQIPKTYGIQIQHDSRVWCIECLLWEESVLYYMYVGYGVISVSSRT